MTNFKASNIDKIPSLSNLNLKGNSLVCSNMHGLKNYCLFNKVHCVTDCDEEKLQKMIAYESETSTVAEYSPWDEEDFDRSTSLEPVTPGACYTPDCDIFLPLIISFVAGLVVGMVNVGLCVCVLKSASRQNSKRRIRYSRNSEVRWSLNSSVPHIRFYNEPNT